MKEKIIHMLNNGYSQAQIVRELKCAKSTVSYHASKIGKGVFKQKKHNWKEIAEYQADGHSVKECRDKFGCCAQVWNDALKKGLVHRIYDKTDVV
jgi:orotate phosphoribosyltransferase-like protein